VPPARILVLTSSTGGGHDARARAFEAWTRKLYGLDVDARVERMLEDASWIGRFGVGFYNFIQRRAPWLHHPYFWLVEGLSAVNRSGVSFGRRYYEETIRSFRPHLVFSVHDCLNRGYFQAARRLLGPANVRCATYCSEFSGGLGYSRNWVEPSADLYLSRTETAHRYAVERLGLDPRRGLVRGHLLTPRVYEETLAPEERRGFLVERLGLRPDRKTVFLTTGGAGANNHLAILPVLKAFADEYQALVVCGRNQGAYLKVLRWQRENPELACHVESYCQEMHLLMQVSDLVLTRGGTTTCSEALHFGCPIVFNGFGGVMPQERLTLKYFLQDEAAAVVNSPAALRRLLLSWRGSPGSFARLRRRFRALRFPGDPSQAVRDLVALAREACRAEEAPAVP